MSEIKSVDLSDLSKKWPSAVVARREVRNFSGGAMTPKYLANLDSSGHGPPGRFRVGRKVVYPVKPFVKWLEARTEVVG